MTDKPTLLPRAVYRSRRGSEWELVCGCERFDDAVTIAKRMDELMIHLYAYVNDEGQLVEVSS